MGSVSISRPAFMSMVVSSIEVYKKEAYGLLLGSRRKSNYKITYTVAIQSVDRDYEYVAVDQVREKRINEIMKFISTSKFIGDFHSHPDFPEKLSRHDIKTMKEAGDTLSLLIIVKKRKKRIKWKYNTKERSIVGPVGKYVIKIFAYRYIEDEDYVEKLRIKVPFLSSLNKLTRFYQKLEKKIEKLEKQKKKAEKKKKHLKKLMRSG